MPIISGLNAGDKSSASAAVGSAAAADDAKGASVVDTRSRFLQKIASTVEWRQPYRDKLFAEYKALERRVKEVTVVYKGKEITLDEAYSDYSANSGYDAWPESACYKAARELSHLITASGAENHELARNHAIKRSNYGDAAYKLVGAKALQVIVTELERRIKEGDAAALEEMGGLIKNGFRLPENRPFVMGISSNGQVINGDLLGNAEAQQNWQEQQYLSGACASVYDDIMPRCHWLHENTDRDERLNLVKYYLSLGTAKLQTKIAAGDAAAMVEYADFVLDHRCASFFPDGKKRSELAFQHYSNAAKLGNPQAMKKLGWWYLGGIHANRDFAQAEKWCLQSKLPQALLMLARDYNRQKNSVKAGELCVQARALATTKQDREDVEKMQTRLQFEAACEKLYGQDIKEAASAVATISKLARNKYDPAQRFLPQAQRLASQMRPAGDEKELGFIDSWNSYSTLCKQGIEVFEDSSKEKDDAEIIQILLRAVPFLSQAKEMSLRLDAAQAPIPKGVNCNTAARTLQCVQGMIGGAHLEGTKMPLDIVKAAELLRPLLNRQGVGIEEIFALSDIRSTLSEAFKDKSSAFAFITACQWKYDRDLETSWTAIDYEALESCEVAPLKVIAPKVASAVHPAVAQAGSPITGAATSAASAAARAASANANADAQESNVLTRSDKCIVS